jgi:enoyl-CoA hydratase/carnithine racemase
MMITVALMRAIPHKAMFDLMATGRLLLPEEALGLGAVSRVVTRADLDSTIDDLVASLARQSPAAMSLGRRALAAIAGLSPLAALDYLHAGLTAVTLTEDAREGLAAFSEKRDPVWIGH